MTPEGWLLAASIDGLPRRRWRRHLHGQERRLKRAASDPSYRGCARPSANDVDLVVFWLVACWAAQLDAIVCVGAAGKADFRQLAATGAQACAASASTSTLLLPAELPADPTGSVLGDSGLKVGQRLEQGPQVGRVDNMAEHVCKQFISSFYAARIIIMRSRGYSP